MENTESISSPPVTYLKLLSMLCSHNIAPAFIRQYAS